MVEEPPSRASSFACSAVIAGLWTTRFTPLSCSELQQDVLHRLGAFLPGGQLGVHAQAIGTGEAGAFSFLLDERDDLAAVDRRILHELQLHRLVRGVDASDAERTSGEANLVALEERACRVGQVAEAIDELLAQRFQLFAS